MTTKCFVNKIYENSNDREKKAKTNKNMVEIFIIKFLAITEIKCALLINKKKKKCLY